MIEQYFPYIYPIIGLIGSLVICIIGIIRGIPSKELKELMKTFSNRNNEVVAQALKTTKDEYYLDEKHDKLVYDRTVDLQEKINSARGCSLDEMLKRMLPSEVAASGYQEIYDRCADDLDAMADAMEVAESYRERFKMSEKATIDDVYKRVAEEAERLEKKLQEVSQNEKKRQSIPPQERSDIQEHSSKSSQEESSKDGK